MSLSPQHAAAYSSAAGLFVSPLLPGSLFIQLPPHVSRMEVDEEFDAPAGAAAPTASVTQPPGRAASCCSVISSAPVAAPRDKRAREERKEATPAAPSVAPTPAPQKRVKLEHDNGNLAYPKPSAFNFKFELTFTGIFPVRWFVPGQPAVAQLICPFCDNVACNPAILETCSHAICRSCLVQGNKRKKECPIDHVPFKSYCRFNATSPFIESLIWQLQARCLNHDDGCEWTGCFGVDGRNLKAHHLVCEFTMTSCPHCRMQLTREQSEHHEAVCRAGVVKCRYCKSKSTWVQPAEGAAAARPPRCTHCEPCPRGCNEPRKASVGGANSASDRADHGAVCPKRLITCTLCTPAHSIACDKLFAHIGSVLPVDRDHLVHAVWKSMQRAPASAPAHAPAHVPAPEPALSTLTKDILSTRSKSPDTSPSRLTLSSQADIQGSRSPDFAFSFARSAPHHTASHLASTFVPSFCVRHISCSSPECLRRSRSLSSSMSSSHSLHTFSMLNLLSLVVKHRECCARIAQLEARWLIHSVIATRKTALRASGQHWVMQLSSVAVSGCAIRLRGVVWRGARLTRLDD